MRVLFFLLFVISLSLQSCDDGDILVTDFDFDEITLDLCETTKSNFIYFKINTDTREGISFNFTKADFDEKTVGEFELEVTEKNQFIYRRFNTVIDRNYYCGIIPPSAVTVEEEFIGTSGTATVVTKITNEDDQDGVDEDPESDLDTDNDGIPNYKDQDDDGDNVPTIAELEKGSNAFLDTDGDNIPNHLDADDDGDMLLTKYEEGTTPNGDPRDDRNQDNISNYLDNTIAMELTTEKKNIIDGFKKSNSISTEYKTTITFKDLVLEGLDQRIVDENLSLLGSRLKTESVPSK